MFSFQSKWRYFFMFLGVQLVVMALLSREGYQKRVHYFIRIFRKPDHARNSTTLTAGVDVYANLLNLSKVHPHRDDMPYCPKKSPLIGKFSERRILILQCLLSQYRVLFSPVNISETLCTQWIIWEKKTKQEKTNNA